MSLLKINVYWSEDDSTFRIIEILSSHTYFDLHTIIKKELQLPADMEASVYLSDDQWRKGREISSLIEKNLRDAPALSMKKTPIGALITDPHQKFIYACQHPKAWLFYIDIITLQPDPLRLDLYPRCLKSEGLSPSQLGIIPTQKDSVMEVEERYDLGGDEDGYGDEGESSTENQDDSFDTSESLADDI